MTQIIDQKIRRMRRQLFAPNHSSGDRYRTHTVGFCRIHIIRMVANQRNRCPSLQPSFSPRILQRNTNQCSPVFSLPREGPKPEMLPQSCPFHFPPSNQRQVAGNKTGTGVCRSQFRQKFANPWANLSAQVRASRFIINLSLTHDRRHRFRYDACRHSSIAQHQCQNVTIQHSLRSYMIGAGLNSCHASHSGHQRSPMMRTCPAQQGAVNIEKNYRRSMP